MTSAQSIPVPSLPVIVAIDLGTTFSGYAFGLRRELTQNPLAIYCNQTWNSGNFLSMKTPTCLLLTSREKFKSFGYEAQDQYLELAEENKHQQVHYFKNFKMRLGGYSEFKMDMLIDDESGRAVKAIKVFALSIKYLKDHFLEQLESRVSGMTEADVQWVLTVPAIWSPHAKQFMREAAKQAGINGERLRLALEPEAASVYCVTSGVHVRNPGTVYMLADIGGGTADITLHRVENGGRLSEVYRASGGPWGGIAVDFEFLKLMRDLVGEEVFKYFNEHHKSDSIQLMRSFELAKRSISNVHKRHASVSVPASLREVCETHGCGLEQAIAQSGNAGVRLNRDRLILDFCVMYKFMEPVTKPILERMQEIFRSIPDINDIVLVGGFSECSVMECAVRERFGRVNVKVAPNPEVCVLKGAVQFGFKPATIISRIMRYTYGLHRSEPFDETKHKAELKVKMGGMSRCEKIFQVLVVKDTSIPVDHVIERRSKTLYENQKSIPYDMYTSTSRNPSYITDEGCTSIGSARLDVSNPGQGTKWFRDRYMFGDTEISLEVKESDSGKETKFRFQLPQ